MEEINIPHFLLEKLNDQYGEELTKEIIKGYFINRRVSLRVNTIKATKDEIISVLKDNNIEYSELSFYQDALLLNNVEESVLWNLDIYKEGKIYLQSLSSMMPPLFLEINENSHILDMAAAPGGKTTEMAALSMNKACITAMELNPIRAEKLKFNIQKQGASRVTVLVKDARQLDEFFHFEKILLDAPCSGSGTLSLNDKNAFVYFTPKLISKSSASQFSLLKKGIKALKKGGILIYSTCSILKEENEQVLLKAIKGEKCHIEEIALDEVDGLKLLPSTIKGVITVMPNELYEGFFVSKIVKD